MTRGGAGGAPGPGPQAFARAILARREAALYAAGGLTVFPGIALAPAIPAIERAFGGAEASLLGGLLLSGPAIAVALTAPFAGALGDRLGHVRLLLVSCVLFAALGGAGLWLDSIESIVLSRILLGIPTGAIMASSVALVGASFEEPARSRVLGRQASMMAVAGLVGTIAAGALAALSWRAPFLIFLFSVPVAFLVRSTRWRAPAPGQKPVMAASRFSLRPLASVYAWALGGMALFYLLPLYAPFVIEVALGHGPMASGLVMGGSSAFAALSAWSFGALRRRLPAGAIFALFLLLLAWGYIVVYLAGNLATCFLGVAIASLGVGLLMPNLGSLVMARTSHAARGAAFGGMTSAVFLGQFAAPFLCFPILAVADARATFAVGNIVALLLAAFTLARLAAREATGRD